MDTKKVTTESHNAVQYTNKVLYKCIYNEKTCSKDKLCGDCGMDLYEIEQHEEMVANFKLDRRMMVKDF
jgi:hypothetical protein